MFYHYSHLGSVTPPTPHKAANGRAGTRPQSLTPETKLPIILLKTPETKLPIILLKTHWQVFGMNEGQTCRLKQRHGHPEDLSSSTQKMLRKNHQKSPQHTKLGLVMHKVREGLPQNELRLESVIKLLKQIISIYPSIYIYRHIYIHTHILMGLPRWHEW